MQERAGEQQPSFAVLIPFRNEAENLPALLASLAALAYPTDDYEVILIDDHSEDEGAGAVAGAMEVFKAQGIALRLLSLADHLKGRSVVAHKKEALAYGIANTTAELIFTTDADCQLPPTLLKELAAAFRPEVSLVLGPVLIDPADDFLSGFQALDFAGYQLYTAACVAGGAPTLANGACFAFRREAFLAAGGYAGVDHLPSGDDVLLLHKFNALGATAAWKPGRAVVTTRPVGSWRGLWRQRLRWAGKAGSYVSPELQFGQGLTWALCAAIVCSLPLGIWWPGLLPAALLAWASKAIVDFVLLRDIARHYGQEPPLRWYPLTALLYPFYLFAVGAAALLGVKAGWKGR
ncbi:glycosyltransferase [Neolewinella agarilytica]|uniref:Glycosyltransferase, catalytic subunit of cellulose synthase and poly-beta-1,6-N-acetylglucosamine synthase n=1 Tax=Neolewinella agarilytica TaxID=478744 RepID=A0A1H9GXU6_9BACT|nr:glycosyltransferase [Neolewinella agarilytica]SEQ54909.1 Glycosyltransferase, catalytic subunit of cellulose synthase and poly-beta-1,6-N-acetylglucosamine synthase [Neolewinella agarilytica]